MGYSASEPGWGSPQPRVMDSRSTLSMGDDGFYLSCILSIFFPCDCM